MCPASDALDPTCVYMRFDSTATSNFVHTLGTYLHWNTHFAMLPIPLHICGYTTQDMEKAKEPRGGHGVRDNYLPCFLAHAQGGSVKSLKFDLKTLEIVESFAKATVAAKRNWAAAHQSKGVYRDVLGF